MRYTIDKMTMADIPRVVEIERLSYSSPWPPSAYRKEIQENPLAYYIVARDTQLAVPAPAHAPAEVSRRGFPLSLLPGRSGTTMNPQFASIIGFAGLWLMVDEAHVTTIAVHPDYRHHGIGELMLSSLIEHANDIGARVVTLEVRVTNDVAQNLYRKYGFEGMGIRKRYYSDNDEDALIMSTSEIHDPYYRERFMQLRSQLAQRLSSDEQPGATPQGAPHS